MNAVKRQRPTIPPEDIERLLFHLEDARDYIIRYGAAQGFNSPARAVSDTALNAIDDLAGQITGDRQHLWSKAVTAGGHDVEISEGQNREARRRRLLGVRVPLRVLKASQGID